MPRRLTASSCLGYRKLAPAVRSKHTSLSSALPICKISRQSAVPLRRLASAIYEGALASSRYGNTSTTVKSIWPKLEPIARAFLSQQLRLAFVKPCVRNNKPFDSSLAYLAGFCPSVWLTDAKRFGLFSLVDTTTKDCFESPNFGMHVKRFDWATAAQAWLSLTGRLCR